MLIFHQHPMLIYPTSIPCNVPQHLVAQADLPAELQALQAKGARLGPLLRLLLSALCTATASTDESASKAASALTLFCTLTQQLELEGQDVQAAAGQLLAAGARLIQLPDKEDEEAAEGGDEAGEVSKQEVALQRVCDALRTLDLRHPEAVDAAVNAGLDREAAVAAAATADDAPPQAGGKGGKHKGGKAAAAVAARAGREGVFALVQRCFGGSSHEVVGGGGKGGEGARQTLAVALHAPAEGVRIMVGWVGAFSGGGFLSCTCAAGWLIDWNCAVFTPGVVMLLAHPCCFQMLMDSKRAFFRPFTGIP